MFITNMVISCIMFAALFLSAPLIAAFFEREELVALTRAMGAVVIINALSIVQNTILTKRLDFKTKTKASLISAIGSGIIGIGLAFWGFGVWALVFQSLSRQLLNTISLWFFNKWWPKIQFSWSSFRGMWSFGWKLLISSLLNTTWKELYQIVVGKFYSPATLGQYSRGRQFAAIFSQNLTSIVQRVSYPALSEIQNDSLKLKAAYRKVIKTTMFVTTAAMFALGAVSEPLLYCLIGPQWQEAASFLPLICISMSLYPLHAINLNLLQVQGRSDIFLKLEIIKKIISIGPLMLGIFISIYWMLVGSIITGFINFFLNSFYSGKALGYSSWDQLRDVAPFYGAAGIVAVSIYFFKFLPVSSFIILPIQIILGAAVFIAICKVTKLEEYKEVKGMAKQYLGKIIIH
jgi:O-antigen/teichoic acid export membrane protein